jgi:putative colanic acid biosynthesis UDP-glucose lipid carrier transferase
MGTAAPRHSRRIAADLVGFFDVMAVVAGGIVPAFIYAKAGGLSVGWLKHLQMCLVSAVIVYGCLRNFGMYDVNAMHDFPIRPSRLIGALGIAFLAVLGLGLPFAPSEFHLWIWYSTWIALSFMLLLDVRIAARAVLRRMTAAGVFDTRVAVYGSGTIARRVNQHLADPALGIRFAGLFDDRHDASRVDNDGPALNGRLDDLIAAARSGRVDQIIIALPQAADQRTQMIARRLEPLPVSLHVVTHISSDLVDQGPAHAVSSLGPVGLLDVKQKPLADWSRLVKAAEDRILGSLLLAVALPLMALIAVIVRLDSRGPILFRQRRTGLNQEIIAVLKFRTMHVMEDGSELRQATRDDPRITRVGRVLRRLSLDELPQLLNVLRGDMSLVGPRPHAVAHDERFTEIIARYANRWQVKPGMTGLAQVSGFRGETETPEKMEKRLEQDLAYVNNWSLWLDLKILALTVVRCIWTKNAY